MVVCLYELLAHMSPFGEDHTLYESILSAQYSVEEEEWENIPLHAKLLVQSQMHVDALTRIKAERVLAAAWCQA